MKLHPWPGLGIITLCLGACASYSGFDLHGGIGTCTKLECWKLKNQGTIVCQLKGGDGVIIFSPKMLPWQSWQDAMGNYEKLFESARREATRANTKPVLVVDFGPVSPTETNRGGFPLEKARDIVVLLDSRPGEYPEFDNPPGKLGGAAKISGHYDPRIEISGGDELLGAIDVEMRCLYRGGYYTKAGHIGGP